jgi:hypothetical protein
MICPFQAVSKIKDEWGKKIMFFVEEGRKEKGC